MPVSVVDLGPLPRLYTYHNGTIPLLLAYPEGLNAIKVPYQHQHSTGMKSACWSALYLMNQIVDPKIIVHKWAQEYSMLIYL